MWGHFQRAFQDKAQWNRRGNGIIGRIDQTQEREEANTNTGGRARHGTASQPAIDESRLPTGTTLSAGQQMSIALNDSETTMRYASLFPADVSRASRQCVQSLYSFSARWWINIVFLCDKNF